MERALMCKELVALSHLLAGPDVFRIVGRPYADTAKDTPNAP